MATKGHSIQYCSAELLDSSIHVNMGESFWVGREASAYPSEPLLTRSVNLSRPCSNARDQRTWTGTYPSYEYVVLCCDAQQIVNPGVTLAVRLLLIKLGDITRTR